MMVNVSAPELFAQGFDTLEIARVLGISEGHVLKLVSIERSKRLHRLSPYPVVGADKPVIYASRTVQPRPVLVRVV